MYRLLALLILLTFADSLRRPAGSSTSAGCRRPNQRGEGLLVSISRDLIAFDNKFKDVCKQFPKISPLEIYGDNTYRLEYELPKFLGNFDVRIIHRALYINGHDPQVGTCDRTYVDMRVLPFFVDTHEGAWNFENEVFYVEFPFKYTLDEVQTRCRQDIDETLIHVRKGYVNNYNYDYE